MFKRLIAIIVMTFIMLSQPGITMAFFPLSRLFIMEEKEEKVLSEVNYSLAKRYNDPFVNEVFSDNILLTLAYMSGKVKKGDKFAWSKVREQGESKIILKPGDKFAFHDSVYSQYSDQIVVTTNSHFSYEEGFKSDGYLVGDGVCHLASFINVAAKKAGLEVEAPVNHNFASIPEVEKKDGVSIYYTPVDKNNSSRQNLYITNNQNKTIAFVFNHQNSSLNIKVEESN